MHLICFWLGSVPDPAGELTALPQTSYLDLKGPNREKGNREKMGKRRKIKEREKKSKERGRDGEENEILLKGFTEMTLLPAS